MNTDDLDVTVLYPLKTGGQQCGQPNGAIRVEHLPTKLVAICDWYPSQIKNRRVAMTMLEWGLLELGWEEPTVESKEGAK